MVYTKPKRLKLSRAAYKKNIIYLNKDAYIVPEFLFKAIESMIQGYQNGNPEEHGFDGP